MEFAVSRDVEHLTGSVNRPFRFTRQQDVQRTADDRHLFSFRGAKGVFPFRHHANAGAASAAAGKTDGFHFTGKVFVTLKHELALIFIDKNPL
jgi:hypothetical protein